MNGILLMNKPEGFTSFDVIAKLRGILHMRQLGHSGTLDPMATGVLPVLVGSATRACDLLPCSDKVYLAGFVCGKTSDTQDSSGTVLSESELPVEASELLKILPQFTGEIQQIPPMYSAVQIDGKRLYTLAREGIEVERPARRVVVNQIALCQYDAGTRSGMLRIACQQGVYVRTLIHDVGQQLGCGALMTSLVRECSNGFPLSLCHTLEEVQAAADSGRAEALLMPIEQVFSSLPRLQLDQRQTRLYRNGVPLLLEEFPDAVPDCRYAVFGTEGFLGLGRTEQDRLRVLKNFTKR